MSARRPPNEELNPIACFCGGLARGAREPHLVGHVGGLTPARPNNVRELDATIHRLLIEADRAPLLTLAHCTDELQAFNTPRSDRAKLTAEQVRTAIDRAGSLSGAARALGVDRKTLRIMRRQQDDTESETGTSHGDSSFLPHHTPRIQGD